eukprot:jgi/Chrzof1/1792/Cz10g21090.t1
MDEAMTDAAQPGPSNAVVPVADASGSEVDLSKHPSGIIPQLQNVVATVNLGCSLDLKTIALHARNAEYNPKRFAAVIMRIREPKTTALIFASGKMVCTGAKSENDSRLAARKYCRIIQKLGFGAEFKYEPELFPGLIYRMKQPKIVLLIFVSGKVVLTGAKRRDEIYQAFENIYPTLSEFRKQETAPGLQTLAAQMLPPADRPGTSSAASASTAVAAGGVAAMPPPAPKRTPGTSMLPPPPQPPQSTQMPAATPADVPPATPAWFPPATPAYQLPSTPSYQLVSYIFYMQLPQRTAQS